MSPCKRTNQIEQADEAMKTERRHELKENDLAHFLSTMMEGAKERGQTIGLVVLAIVAVAVVGTWTMSSRSQAHVGAWASKQELTYPNPEEGRLNLATLVSLRRASSDKTFVLDCLTDQGAIALDLANRTTPAPDPQLTATAKEAFDELLALFGSQLVPEGVGRSGLASVAENEFAIDQNPAHKEEARRHLKAITENSELFSGTPFMDNALARLNDLDRVFTPITFAPAAQTPAPPAIEESGDSTEEDAAGDADASSEQADPPVETDDPTATNDPPGSAG